jgi:hypothetical protein
MPVDARGETEETAARLGRREALRRTAVLAGAALHAGCRATAGPAA